MRTCPCGQPLESTNKCYYTIRHYNEKNEVIYEMCVHRKVTIDKKEENDTKIKEDNI